MEIKVLGAHNTESRNTKYMSLLIDGVLALDAGGLASSLSFRAQQKIKAILLTHHHYDHIRDVPAIAINLFLRNATIDVYGAKPVYDALAKHLLNDELYPDFMARPPENPTVKFTLIEPLKPVQIEGYDILAVPMKHAIPATGYQVTSGDKTIFYTSDTGPGLQDCWRHIMPQVLFIEVTGSNKYHDFAIRAGHLTPSLLKPELASFRSEKGYLPQIVAVHLNPTDEKDIVPELSAVAGELGCSISIAHEGMVVRL